MIRHVRVLTLGFFCAVAVPSAHAQEEGRTDASPSSPKDIDEVSLESLLNAPLEVASGTSQTLRDSPGVVTVMTREEILFANDAAAQAKGYVLAAYTKALPSPGAPTLQFEPKRYETFDESSDLYHDGSVVVVPLRGHTPGSVGIFVNLSPARRFFYVGDSVDDERGFEDRVAKTLLLRDSDNDPVAANQIVSKLSQLHDTVPALAIIPAHGRSAYKKLFPRGPWTCVAGE